MKKIFFLFCALFSILTNVYSVDKHNEISSSYETPGNPYDKVITKKDLKNVLNIWQETLNMLSQNTNFQFFDKNGNKTNAVTKLIQDIITKTNISASQFKKNLEELNEAITKTDITKHISNLINIIQKEAQKDGLLNQEELLITNHIDIINPIREVTKIKNSSHQYVEVIHAKINNTEYQKQEIHALLQGLSSILDKNPEEQKVFFVRVNKIKNFRYPLTLDTLIENPKDYIEQVREHLETAQEELGSTKIAHTSLSEYSSEKNKIQNSIKIFIKMFGGNTILGPNLFKKIKSDFEEIKSNFQKNNLLKRSLEQEYNELEQKIAAQENLEKLLKQKEERLDELLSRVSTDDDSKISLYSEIEDFLKDINSKDNSKIKNSLKPKLTSLSFHFDQLEAELNKEQTTIEEKIKLQQIQEEKLLENILHKIPDAYTTLYKCMANLFTKSEQIKTADTAYDEEEFSSLEELILQINKCNSTVKKQNKFKEIEDFEKKFTQAKELPERIVQKNVLNELSLFLDELKDDAQTQSIFMAWACAVLKIDENSANLDEVIESVRKKDGLLQQDLFEIEASITAKLPQESLQRAGILGNKRIAVANSPAMEHQPQNINQQPNKNKQNFFSKYKKWFAGSAITLLGISWFSKKQQTKELFSLKNITGVGSGLCTTAATYGFYQDWKNNKKSIQN